MVQLGSQFKINMQGTEHLSELEKDSVKYYQILQQCEGNFRALSQNVIPSIINIGTENPNLIIESVKLLASPQFVGNRNFLTAKVSASGLESLVKAIPDIATYLRDEKLDYLNELLKERSKIIDAQWQDYYKILLNVITSLGQENKPINATPTEKLIQQNVLRSYSGTMQKSILKNGADLMPQIFIIHGHDPTSLSYLKGVLYKIGANPRTFDDIPKQGSPTIIEILENYISKCDAIIAFLTPDDEGRKRGDETWELRARQNVLIEAGYGLISQREKSLIIALGNVSTPSDFDGIHMIRASMWSTETGMNIAKRLKDMGLKVDPSKAV